MWTSLSFGSLRLMPGTTPPPLNNKPPTVATNRLLCAPPCVCTALICTALCIHRLLCGLRPAPLDVGDTPAPHLNNKTPAVATDRLLCAPPCVCTALCVYRLACGALNNKTPAVATWCLLCAPPCVCTALCVYRLACGTLNNKDSFGGYRPPFVCTALCVHRLVYALACMCTALCMHGLVCGLRASSVPPPPPCAKSPACAPH